MHAVAMPLNRWWAQSLRRACHLPLRAVAATFLGAAVVALSACGGGDSGSPSPAAPVRLVGEVLAGPGQIATSELRATVGYSGDLATSRALAAAGRANILDLLFVFHGAQREPAPSVQPRPEAAAELARYARENADLLVPGVRVVILDEIFWNAGLPSTSAADLQARTEGLRAAVALVRQAMPLVRVGITVTPYAVAGDAATQARVRAAISQALTTVDWVGTDPYWFGNPAEVAGLNAWTERFADDARAANPRIETWLIAQAFKSPDWDSAAFTTHINAQLSHAGRYDHVLFFGWQFVSELTPLWAGRNLPPSLKALYGPFLRP